MVTLPIRGTTPASRLALLAALAPVSSVALGGCTADPPAPSPSRDDVTATPFVPGPAAVQEDIACPAILEQIPVLWLVNAEGGAIDAAWPTTECRQTSGKPETQKAIDALTTGQTKVIAPPQQVK